MYYKQTVDGVKLVILSLDGGILDLNRLRYNYLNHTCKQYNQKITKDIFTNNLGNMNTMYSYSPIQDIISNEKLNDTIEHDLYEYSKVKLNIKKEGVEELFQFFKQKQIKIAVISTHKTKRAIQYLQLAQIYKYIDFVIGGDSEALPLPSEEPLKLICQQMNVKPDNTLVVANYPNLVLAANKLLMNIIYIPDLVPADFFIESSTYRVARNNLEAINTILFAKYDTVEIFSPMLRMSKTMDAATLKTTYENLLVEFADDNKLIELVNQTYHFLLSEINDKATREQLSKGQNTEDEHIKYDFIFEESLINEAVVEDVIETNVLNEINNVSEDLKEEIVVREEPIITEVTQTSNKEDIEPVVEIIEIKHEAEKINDLMDQINSIGNQKVIEDEEVVEDGKDEFVKDSNVLFDVIYSTVTSLIIVIISMIGYMLARDFIESKGIFQGILRRSIDLYINAVRSVYAFIFNGLNSIVSFIPNYNSLLKGNDYISELGVQILMFTIFNVIIFYIIKYLFRLMSGRNDEKD